MKANREYTCKDPLKIMDMKIDSSKCCNVQIKYTIDARHILLAITGISGKEEITRKEVEEEIKHQLYMRGEDWYMSPIDYGEEEHLHHNLEENLEKALPLAKKLFPEFFNFPNSIKFIKDDA